MSSLHDLVKIGIVSISDRASTGVYEDKGLPALQTWLTTALKNTLQFEARLIPDEKERISATLIELVDAGCSLVLTTGDGFDYREQAQRLQSGLGKIMRMADDGRPLAGNPFVGKAGAQPHIWSYGHRNPQGLAVDAVTGRLWAHEHGPQGGDELNLIQKGGNYGWPVATKGLDYSGATISPFKTYPGMIDGRAVWVPSIAPSGLAVYRGALWPAWAGDLIVGALVNKEVRRLDVDAAGKVIGQERIFPSIKARIRDVRVAPDGAVWLTTDEDAGKVLRVTP